MKINKKKIISGGEPLLFNPNVPFTNNIIVTEMPIVNSTLPIMDYTPVSPYDDYYHMPTMDEILLTHFPNYLDYDDVNLYHLGESIFNKWQYVDDYSKLRINNYFLKNYPDNWIFDLNSFYDSDSFINFLLMDYPRSLRRDIITEDDLIFLYLLDKSLSTKLKKEIKEQCEKTKIEGLARKIWESFGQNIETVDLNDNMIAKFKYNFSQYDTDLINMVYKLLKKCKSAIKSKSKSKSFEIDTLLGLFKGCDIDSFKNAIDEYEKKNKKYY
jgi:hypothetical protein